MVPTPALYYMAASGAKWLDTPPIRDGTRSMPRGPNQPCDGLRRIRIYVLTVRRRC